MLLHIEERLRGVEWVEASISLTFTFNPVLDHCASECLYRMRKISRLRARKFYGIGTKDEKINEK
jgi:hypothetical protein